MFSAAYDFYITFSKLIYSGKRSENEIGTIVGQA